MPPRNLRTGILDPFGDILAECRELDDKMVLARLTPEKRTVAGGYRYMNARRPKLYRDILGQAQCVRTESGLVKFPQGNKSMISRPFSPPAIHRKGW